MMFVIMMLVIMMLVIMQFIIMSNLCIIIVFSKPLHPSVFLLLIYFNNILTYLYQYLYDLPVKIFYIIHFKFLIVIFYLIALHQIIILLTFQTTHKVKIISHYLITNHSKAIIFTFNVFRLTVYFLNIKNYLTNYSLYMYPTNNYNNLYGTCTVLDICPVQTFANYIMQQ